MTPPGCQRPGAPAAATGCAAPTPRLCRPRNAPAPPPAAAPRRPPGRRRCRPQRDPPAALAPAASQLQGGSTHSGHIRPLVCKDVQMLSCRAGRSGLCAPAAGQRLVCNTDRARWLLCRPGLSVRPAADWSLCNQTSWAAVCKAARVKRALSWRPVASSRCGQSISSSSKRWETAQRNLA